MCFLNTFIRFYFNGLFIICKVMFSLHNIQDIILCHLCDTPVPHLNFDICDINLCKRCAADQLLDNSIQHKFVPIKPKQTQQLLICIVN